MTFHELGLNKSILKSIEELGFTEATPIQAATIPQVLEGKDVIGSAQTGTGKTAAFALPILHRLDQIQKDAKPHCLVLGPTRELVVQIYDHFQSFSKYSAVKSCLVHGGVGYNQQIDELERGADVVIATPGRLLDHSERRTVNLRSVELLVLDEVDRMLDLGFINEVMRIIKLCNKKRQTLLFSATVSESIKRLVAQNLKDPVEISIGVELSPADTVKHEVYPVGALQKFDLLMALIESQKIDSMIVFCRMKSGVDRIVRWLKEHDYPCVAMHSDLPQKKRTNALEQFKKGAIKILVATDIASRGLDIANVTHVINYDVPEHPEDYVHRIGRTGRARKEGDAATLLAPDEQSKIDAIEALIGQQIPQRKLEHFNYFQEPFIRDESPVAPRRRKRNSGSSRFGRRGS
jgi:superfamily II DNA/RNA helicase